MDEMELDFNFDGEDERIEEEDEPLGSDEEDDEVERARASKYISSRRRAS